MSGFACMYVTDNSRLAGMYTGNDGAMIAVLYAPLGFDFLH
jgi:hypothetical protein